LSLPVDRVPLSIVVFALSCDDDPDGTHRPP
jgi:hypothetical protein